MLGLVFSFLLFPGNRAGCKHRQSVTEARLREPETCPFRCRERKKGNCNLYGRTAVGRGSGGGGHGRGAFSVSATKSWPPPACLSRAKFSFPESSNKKKKRGRQQAPPVHQTTTHVSRQPRSLPPAGHAHVRSAKHVPAGRGAMPACPLRRPSRYDTTPTQTHGQRVIV